MAAWPAHAQPASGQALAVVRVEVVRAEALEAQGDGGIERDQPPAQGWQAVSLPDMWSARWPGFDGVVWYRVHWQQRDRQQPAALMFDYLNMAGVVYLNGNLLARDSQLTEP